MHQHSQSNAGTQAVFSWQSDLGPNAGSWDVSREVTIPITGNDMWYTYTVDLSAEANWLGHHITAIRLEPTYGVAANVELDLLWGPEVGTFSQPQTVIAPPALLLGIDPDVALFLEQANTDAFGLDWNRIFQANADDEPHGYTGQEREDDLDVLFYGARLYMPELGRFLQVDPAREFHNPYSYVGNNPIDSIDPTGTTDNDFDKAILSQHVYTSNGENPGPLPAGYSMLALAERSALINIGFVFDDPSTGFQSDIYYNENSNEYVYVFAGTDLVSLKDWIANGKNGVGLLSEQYQTAIRNTEMLLDVLPGKLTLAGHSLGGGLASAGAMVFGLDAFTYNAAGLSYGTLIRNGVPLEDILVGRGEDHIRAFYVVGEVLSYNQDLLPLFPNAYGSRIPLAPINNPPWWDLPARGIRTALKHGIGEVLSLEDQVRGAQ